MGQTQKHKTAVIFFSTCDKTDEEYEVADYEFGLIAHRYDKAEQYVQEPNHFALTDFHGYALGHKVRLCTVQPFSIQKPPFAAILPDRCKEAQINVAAERTVGNFLQASLTLGIQQRYCCHRSE
jgi:hypothetical protein